MPAHVRVRLVALARYLQISSAEALAIAVQALEATLKAEERVHFEHYLRRQLADAGRREPIAVADLPVLPPLVPALGTQVKEFGVPMAREIAREMRLERQRLKAVTPPDTDPPPTIRPTGEGDDGDAA